MSSRIRANALQRAARIALPAMVLSAGFGAGANANVLISSGATTNITCTSGVCTPTKGGAILNATQLVDMLASGSVKITTDGAKAANIMINAPLSWASGSVLTLDAYQSVTVTKSVSVTGSGGVSILTNDGGTGGAFSFGPKGSVAFLSLSSPLTINGASYTLVDDIATLASDIAATPSGNFALAAVYNATADGTYASSPIPTTFTGNFEGLGNTVSHLKINSSSPVVGLFGEVGSGGDVRDFGLQAFDMETSGSVQVGALAGENLGTLSHDFVSGKSVAGGTYLGGLVGLNGGTVEVCFAQGTLSEVEKGSVMVGGLVGSNDGAILDSYASNSVRGGKGTMVGGLAGYAIGTISNSYATGSVQGGAQSYVGALIGEVTASSDAPTSISDSYATGELTGGNNSILGGLVGFIRGGVGGITFANTYWDVSTTGVTDAGQGVGNITNEPGITGDTNAQLQSGLPAGFSSTVWGESTSINGGLPYLLALPQG